MHSPGQDEPLVEYSGAGTSNRSFLHADARGSIIAHTDSAGALTATLTYDAYGNPGASNPSTTYGYTGQVWLADVGLYHYKNRTYHPGLMRFLQTDPIGVAGGMNLYAYVGGDPMNFTDPWGLSMKGEDPIKVICGAICEFWRLYQQELKSFFRDLDQLPGGYAGELILEPVSSEEPGEEDGNSVDCPSGGRNSEGNFAAHEGRAFGPAPSDPLAFLKKFVSHPLFRNAHRISYDTDREIGFGFVTTGGQLVLASMTWGPARDGEVSVSFTGGAPYLFLHTHGRTTSTPGLSSGGEDGDLSISRRGIATAAVEGSGAMYYAGAFSISGTNVGHMSRLSGRSGC